MTPEQQLVDFLEGLGPLLQEAMLDANKHGSHDLRRRLQASYMASLELIEKTVRVRNTSTTAQFGSVIDRQKT